MLAAKASGVAQADLASSSSDAGRATSSLSSRSRPTTANGSSEGHTATAAYDRPIEEVLQGGSGFQDRSLRSSETFLLW